MAPPETARPLLEASHALMESLYPSESNHYLSLSELSAPNIRFLVAQEKDAVLGCGALAIKPGYGEVKSMFTARSARGRGVADAVLKDIIVIARNEGLAELKLETGNTLLAAHRLYERHGFQRCGPFGNYPSDPISFFYEKGL